MLNQKRHLDYADDEGRDDDADPAIDENSIEEVEKEGAEDHDDDDGLRLEWEMTDWSRCSQTCGPNGKQVGKFKVYFNALPGSKISNFHSRAVSCGELCRGAT